VDTIIGLGNAGCNIVDKFAKYSQYITYKLDVGMPMTPTTFSLERFQNIEDYEEKCPDLGSFFNEVTDEILFVIGGGGRISSAALSILKQLKNHKINILYIKPDVSFLGQQSLMLDNLVFNVLQEYARSGVFERLYVVDNACIEKAIPAVSVKNYYDNLNDAIVSTFHMINVFNHIESVTDTFSDLPAGARISTVGFLDPKKNLDKMFFYLDNVSDIVYYYAYNKVKLETENNLFGDIRNSLKRKMEPGVRVSYGIFETDYEEDYVYCINHTSVIQGQQKDGGSGHLPTSP
jgi:hypothetical protein